MKKINPPSSETFARIRVIGVGGSGGNVVNHMIRSGMEGVEFIVANTDLQDLQSSKASKKIHLGRKTTQGLGAGMDPSVGEKSALESSDEIKEVLKGADIIFIACGEGGGTGTGAAPIFAQIAQNFDILTVSVVTRPFSFEGVQRKNIADEGILKLAKYTDSLVVIPNDTILAMSGEKTSMAEAFTQSDEVLKQAVGGVSQLITRTGDINIDFADLKAIIKDSGNALLGIGSARGNAKAEFAISKAIASPLLEHPITGAKRVLFSIASRNRNEITMKEVQYIAERINEVVDPHAKIIFGSVTDKQLKQGEIRITLIATDLESKNVGLKDQAQERERKSTEPAEQMASAIERDRKTSNRLRDYTSDIHSRVINRNVKEKEDDGKIMEGEYVEGEVYEDGEYEEEEYVEEVLDGENEEEVRGPDGKNYATKKISKKINLSNLWKKK